MSPRARLPVPSIRSGEPEGGWSPVVAPAVVPPTRCCRKGSPADAHLPSWGMGHW
ncbi:hypothetical protein PI95_000045 [Hassallia byssoidea VB512170]|uniref:Uncharacterized protein n=1 Tax=Hassallia byssoidea VB512170 TaxID=1304833 RepID=A0A846GYT6_9CYAN|nr:hypothetical protein [Hassalia byssoidea]NEU71006.1 hypothetical protein [Hassalia byssoidea VB512170]